jgi:hypothetical protein
LQSYLYEYRLALQQPWRAGDVPQAAASHPSELVLDPFCGSGATGHAARSLSRRALLADVDTATARRRLRLTIDQRGLAQA